MNKKRPSMYILGLTGSMGCGKSSVAQLLVARGGYLLDSDQMAKETLTMGSPGYQQVVQRFGHEILGPSRDVDRGRLGAALQEDPNAWSDLEAIIHPHVRRLQAETILRHSQENLAAVVILDEPLLFETGGDALCDLVLVVACGDRQLDRLRQRGGSVVTEVQKAAMARQMPEEEKCRRADRVIDNRGSLTDTTRQVDEFWAWLGCLATRAVEQAWPVKWARFM
ncbi:MAG: dephospho-CoA kinase [Magnetococcus sp. DMHC-1]|nr:dephospho-CoA kinase [Magnetococcales bacterium]